MHSVVVFSKEEGTDPLALVFVTGSIDKQSNSPVLCHLTGHKPLFSSPTVCSILSLQSHHCLLICVSPRTGRLGARLLVVFALHFQMMSVSFLMTPVMMPAWCRLCSLTIPHSFLSSQGSPLHWSTHSSKRLMPYPRPQPL